MTGRKLAALLLGTLFGVLLAEGGARALSLDLRLVEPLVPRNRADLAVHETVPDPALLYRLRPDLSHRFEQPQTWGLSARTVTTNSLGHRDPPRDPAHRPALRILALGGSNTYGAVVNDGDTWPRQLERELAERLQADVEVWNLGVSGYMTRQKLAALEEELPRARPDLVLLQTYNTGPRYLPDGDPVGPRLAQEPALWAELLTHVPLGEDGRPGAAFRASALLRTVVVARNLWERSHDQDAHVGQITQRCEEREGERLRAALDGPLAGVPVLAFITPAGAPRHQLLASGVPWFDLSDGPVPEGAEAREIHPGASVYRWYAEQLADRLIAAGCGGPGGCRLPR